MGSETRDRNRETTRDLLVVGAGPVGLATALLGARAGLDVEVVDQEWRIAARSYACALHPHTLELLDRFGVLPRALELGRRVDRVAFYEGMERQAEVHLGALPGRFPFALVMYQDDLEGLLEDALRDHHGRKVGWGRRLGGLTWQEDAVTAVLERLQHEATGDQAHRWTEVVDRRMLVRTRYLVGADGAGSKLAHLLGTGSELAGDPLNYAIYEFEPESDPGGELRIVVGARTTHSLWPLPGGTCRWAMQIAPPARGDETAGPPEGQPVLEAPVGAGGRRGLVERIRQAAPWFQHGVRNLDWAMRLEFPRRVVHQFGRGRCWMLGDAAHQTAPDGAQSMNVAFLQAEEFVDLIRRNLREDAPAVALHESGTRWQAHWRRLLGLAPAIEPTSAATPWVRAHGARLLPCLPASGQDLVAMLGQLGLAWR